MIGPTAEEALVSEVDFERLKQALMDAGVEIYQTKESEIQIAERVRLHLMDSSVRVRLSPDTRIRFTARAQKSDFPGVAPEQLFAKVRGAIEGEARGRGYAEMSATTVEVTDPMDSKRVLDVWHEVTYEKAADAMDTAIEEVRWALALEKYVT